MAAWSTGSLPSRMLASLPDGRHARGRGEDDHRRVSPDDPHGEARALRRPLVRRAPAVGGAYSREASRSRRARGSCPSGGAPLPCRASAARARLGAWDRLNATSTTRRQHGEGRRCATQHTSSRTSGLTPMCHAICAHRQTPRPHLANGYHTRVVPSGSSLDAACASARRRAQPLMAVALARKSRVAGTSRMCLTATGLLHRLARSLRP
jgi:hypothetical protein